MKKIILFLLLTTIVLMPGLKAQTEFEEPEIIILDNEGLTRYAENNYTYDCESANSNILTIVVKQTVGYTYLTIAHEIENLWIEEGINFLDKQNNVYNIQFTLNGQYRVRLLRDYEGNVTQKDIYIFVSGGS